MSVDGGPPSGDLSEFETQFVPRSNDDEVLWEVVEIVAERGSKYQVRWAGKDPKTGKPWPLDWVPKRDCTNHLVKEWKKQKAKKRRRSKKTGDQPTTKSRSSTLSMVPSTTTRMTRSVSEDNMSTGDEEPPHAQSPPSKSRSSKRKRSDAAKGLPDIRESAETPEPEYPKKRRKLVGQEPAKQMRKYSPGTLEGRGHHNESDADSGVASDGADEETIASRGDLPTRKHSILKPKDRALISTPGKRRVTAIKTPTKPERSTGHGRGVAYSKKQRGITTLSSEDDESINKSVKPLVSRFADGKTNSENVTEDVATKPSQAHSTAALRIPPPTHSRSSSSIYAPTSRTRPVLSPGARARLEIFDRMMGTGPDANIYENTAYNATDNFEPYDSPNPAPNSTPMTTVTTGRSRDSPSPVPETDSSQPQRPLPKSKANGKNADASPPLKPSPSRPTSPPGKLQFVPPVVIMVAPSSSKSPLHEDHARGDVPTRPRKQATRPIPRISPATFRKAVEPFASELDNEPPMSSIESFSSPRKDKGKQQHPDDIEGSSDMQPVPGPTDTELRAKGEALYEQALTKRKLLRVTGTVPKKTFADVAQSNVPSKQSTSDAYPFSSGKRDQQGNLEIVQQMEDAYVDLSGGNSMTIDTFTQSGPQNQEVRPTAIRQEVEESTQEALLGGNPALPANVAGIPEVQPQIISDIQSELEDMASRQTSLCKDTGPSTQDILPSNVPVNIAENELESQEFVIDDVDICGENDAQASSSMVEQSKSDQPSAFVDDLHVASMIVNPSQGQRQDMDNEDIIIDLTSLPIRRSPQSNTDTTIGRLNHALSALNQKSDEIQALQHELALEREKSSNLQDELNAVRQSGSPTTQEVSASSADPTCTVQTQPAISELADIRVKWDQERDLWEEERRKWREELTELTTERDRLETDLRSVDEARASWDADRAAFQREREQWADERNKLGFQVTSGPTERTNCSEEDPPLSDQATSMAESHGTFAAEQVRLQQQQIATELWETERERWSAERATMVEAREALAEDVARLNSSLDAITRAKTLAERDRDFFRDQYMQASEFVSTTRAENVELEQKAAIAESRARDGVALIQSMLESQIKALKEDVDKWKGVATLLQEKDHRTDDLIRQRAAEHPELLERCRQLEDQIDTLHVELELAYQGTSIQRNKILHAFSDLREQKEKLGWRSMNLTYPGAEPGEITEELSPDVAWALDALDNLSEEEADDDGCGLYPCKWRTGAKVIDQCQQAFDCKEDLDRHMHNHYNQQVEAMAPRD